AFAGVHPEEEWLGAACAAFVLRHVAGQNVNARLRIMPACTVGHDVQLHSRDVVVTCGSVVARIPVAIDAARIRKGRAGLWIRAIDLEPAATGPIGKK